MAQGGGRGSDPIPTFIKHCFYGIFDLFLPKISEKFTEKIPTIGEGGSSRFKFPTFTEIFFESFPNLNKDTFFSYHLRKKSTLSVSRWPLSSQLLWRQKLASFSSQRHQIPKLDHLPSGDFPSFADAGSLLGVDLTRRTCIHKAGIYFQESKSLLPSGFQVPMWTFFIFWVPKRSPFSPFQAQERTKSQSSHYLLNVDHLNTCYVKTRVNESHARLSV